MVFPWSVVIEKAGAGPPSLAEESCKLKTIRPVKARVRTMRRARGADALLQSGVKLPPSSAGAFGAAPILRVLLKDPIRAFFIAKRPVAQDSGLNYSI